MRILGFWHIAKLGPFWDKIYTTQWEAVKASGLLDATERLAVSMVGSTSPSDIPLDGLPANQHPKVTFAGDSNVESFEFPTLGMLRHAAATEAEPFFAYYIHTKGAATANWDTKNCAFWWGEYMRHYIVDKWRDCVNALDAGSDICGVEYRTEPAKHFSGNFFWVKSEYVKNLPPMEDYWGENRWDRIRAEMYIMRANPKHQCLKNFNRDLYRFAATPDLWT